MESPGRIRQQEHTAKAILIELIIVLKNVIKALSVAFMRLLVSPTPKTVIGEIVLITGSGQGLGRQLSLEFSKMGAIVVLWDVNEAENEETAKQIKAVGGVCYPFTCDVSNRQEVYRIGLRVQEEIGEVSILVNNAGVVSGKKLLDIPDHMIEKTFNVNLMAHFWTVKCFLPSMLRRNHGHIVNIASSAGLVGLNKLTDYSSSKFGVVGFTEVLNYEIVFSGYTGVHTTLVCPSFIKTGMFRGCQMRFPYLLPAQDLSATVSKIMAAILTNQHILCIPRSVYLFPLTKLFLPVSCLPDIFKFTGAASFMDTFIGHAKEQVQNGNENHVHGEPVTDVAMATPDPLATDSIVMNGSVTLADSISKKDN